MKRISVRFGGALALIATAVAAGYRNQCSCAGDGKVASPVYKKSSVDGSPLLADVV